jgi:hypothetical protein
MRNEKETPFWRYPKDPKPEDDDSQEVKRLIQSTTSRLDELDQKIERIKEQRDDLKESRVRKIWDKRVQEDNAFYCGGCGKPVPYEDVGAKPASKGYCNHCYQTTRDLDKIDKFKDKLPGVISVNANTSRKDSGEIKELMIENKEGERFKLLANDKIGDKGLDIERVEE